MDRTVYDRFAYVQRGDFCVLASYAAALWPWLRATPLAYFVAYCEALGLPADPPGAEQTYLTDFIARYSEPGWTGYKVVLALHQKAKHPLFEAARKAVSEEFVDEVPADAARVEAQLRSTDRTLMTFVSQSAFSGLNRMHSIAVIHDERFWHFDANNCRLQKSADVLNALGVLGEGIIFEGRAPATGAA